MRFIDTHAHLYDEQFSNDIDLTIQRAIDNGVDKMYMPNCDSTTIEGMLAIEERWKDHCFSMIGLHPVYVKEDYQQELNIIQEWLVKKRFCAVGEIGIDKYWDVSFLEQQKEAFALQIDWALQNDLPIVIHSREATRDCIDIVRSKQIGSLRGIFHCFSGTLEEAQEIINLGLLLGIGGVATFKKSSLPEVIQSVDLTHIVLETDAPYLAPMPYRGKRNESSYIPLIAAQVAAIKNLSVEEVATITTANAEIIFGN
ncbi:MAG TPA: TatD family hydrolase [Flavipsychrobacter sp.]|nr:TatD family hydrolase [Flavipsychrobacter sp.]